MGLFDGIIASGKTPTIKDYFANIGTPDVADMEIQLQDLVQQGVITPEEAQAALVDGSAMEGITLDPALKQKQMASLAALEELAANGGMMASDEANLNRIRNEELASARGAREAIINNANARGMGGSGLELASQLMNQQEGANRTAQRDMDIAAQAQDRALQAIMQGGQMAGDVRNQDFNQAAQVAGAQDAIAKFNAANSQAVNLANTQAKNTAQAANLAEKQRVADTNAQTSNQQQIYNKNLLQQNYDNKLKKAQGQSGVATQNAANQGANSQAAANAQNQLMGGLLGVGAAYAGRKEHGGLIFEGSPDGVDDVFMNTTKGEFVIPKEKVGDYLTKVHTDEDGNFDASAFIDDILGVPQKKRGA